jgi:hypothetical protein
VSDDVKEICAVSAAMGLLCVRWPPKRQAAQNKRTRMEREFLLAVRTLLPDKLIMSSCFSRRLLIPMDGKMARIEVKDSPCLDLDIGLAFEASDGGLERICDKQSLGLMEVSELKLAFLGDVKS